MSLERIVTSIETKGIEGIKKVTLRREFQEVELDSILEQLVRSQEIFVEKKGTSLHYWHKSHYLQKLMNTDQRFSLIYSSIGSLENSLITKVDYASSKIDDLVENINVLASEIRALSQIQVGDTNRQDRSQHEEQKVVEARKIDYDALKEQLDYAIAHSSNSIGWVELSELRKQLCETFDISQDQFYQSIERIISDNHSRYELSTGGEEGIQVRGLLHGFVRSI